MEKSFWNLLDSSHFHEFAVEAISYNAVTGKITFDAQHNPVKGAVVIHIKDGQKTFDSFMSPPALSEATARELSRIMSSYEDIDGIYNQAGKAFAARLQPNIQSKIKRQLTNDEKERLSQFWYAKLQELMPVASIQDSLVIILNKNLTDAEMHELIAFYTSTIGQKLLVLQPTFKAEEQKAAAELGRTAMQQENVEKIRIELKIAFPEWFAQPGT
jgi:hypothetical protein